MKPIAVLREQETWSPKEASAVLGIDYHRVLAAFRGGEVVARYATNQGRASADEVRAWWRAQPTELLGGVR